MKPKHRATAAVLIALGAAAAPPSASAQEYKLAPMGGLSSGMEGGGPLAMRRTRTRLRLGMEGFVDETPDDLFQVAALAEIEPHSAFGADVRYARAAGQHFVVDAGLMGILAPASLYGACAGLQYRLAISKKAQVTFGPEADFFFLGSDLPKSFVIWQLRFEGGIRVDL